MYFRTPNANVIAGLPDILLGATFLVTWIDPYALGDNMVPFLFQVMLLEFIIFHSSGFMSGVMFGGGDTKKRLILLLLLGAFYMIFAVSFAIGFGSWWPVIAFGMLLVNRMLGVLTGQSTEGKEKEFAMRMWAVGVFFYLVTVFASILLPLPALGVSYDHIRHLGISGEFVDEPHRMLAWGFLYYCLTAIVEFSTAQQEGAVS